MLGGYVSHSFIDECGGSLHLFLRSSGIISMLPTHPSRRNYIIGVGFHLGGCKCFFPSTSGLNNKTTHYFWSCMGRKKGSH